MIRPQEARFRATRQGLREVMTGLSSRSLELNLLLTRSILIMGVLFLHYLQLELSPVRLRLLSGQISRPNHHDDQPIKLGFR